MTTKTPFPQGLYGEVQRFKIEVHAADEGGGVEHADGVVVVAADLDDAAVLALST